MTKNDLVETEFDPYYWRYIDKLDDEQSLVKGFEIGLEKTIHFFHTIPEEKLQYKYEPKKWTIKEVLQHLIDTERIFMYRCFRIARRDVTSLAGYNQEIYMSPSRANRKHIDQLIFEYQSCRHNSITLLDSLSDEDLKFVGDANSGSMSARAAAFTIIGHDIWHIDIIKERYL